MKIVGTWYLDRDKLVSTARHAFMVVFAMQLLLACILSLAQITMCSLVLVGMEFCGVVLFGSTLRCASTFEPSIVYPCRAFIISRYSERWCVRLWLLA